MLVGRFSLLLALLFAISGCSTSSSEPSDPVPSGPASTSAAGAAALSSEPIDPLTCEGVLGRPPDSHTLGLQSLTESGQAGSEGVDAMCSAVYETSTPGDPFLAIALIKFDADGQAAAHCGLLKGVFVAQGIPLSEVNSADEGPLDWVSGLIDREGIGRTTVLRQRNWVATVSVGPTIAASLWTATDILAIGESIIDRAQR